MSDTTDNLLLNPFYWLQDKTGFSKCWFYNFDGCCCEEEPTSSQILSEVPEVKVTDDPSIISRPPSNPFYRYPYCWFGDFKGCEPEVIPEPPMFQSLINQPKPTPPIKPVGEFGDLSLVFNPDTPILILLACFIGFLTGIYVLHLIRRKHFPSLPKLFSIGVETKISSQSSISVLSNEDLVNNNSNDIAPPLLLDDKIATKMEDLENNNIIPVPIGIEEIEFSTKDKEKQADRSNTEFEDLVKKAAPPAANLKEMMFSPSTILGNKFPSTTATVANYTLAHAHSNELERPFIELHQYSRGHSIPCESPWGLKLESLLRILKIPYVIVFDCETQNLPWLICRNNDGNDQNSYATDGNSAALHEFLLKMFPESRKLEALTLLSGRKEVPAHFLTSLVEFHMNPILLKAIHVEMSHVRSGTDYGKIVMEYKTKSELHKALHDDLTSLSAALDSKLYFFGDQISDVDCTIFGTLAQLVWSSPEITCLQPMIYRFMNLVQYCFRARSIIWPDWHSNLTKEVLKVVSSSSEPSRLPAGAVLTTTETLEGEEDPFNEPGSPPCNTPTPQIGLGGYVTCADDDDDEWD